MPADDDPQRNPPQSPCVRRCTLDESDCCLGCFRRIEEIVGWRAMTAAQQWQVIEAAERRRREREQKAGMQPRAIGEPPWT